MMPETFDSSSPAHRRQPGRHRHPRHRASATAGSPRSAAIDPAAAGEVVDCTGLHILPGVIDTQVHFREPGAEHKEDLESGSRAAVMGGVTAVFEMPNTSPLTVTAAALADKVRARHRRACIATSPSSSAAPTAMSTNVQELERLPGAAGIKIFMGSSTGDLLVADDEGLARDPVADTAARLDPCRGRAAADRPRRPSRRGRSRRPIRSGATRPRRSAPPSGWCASPARPARGSISSTSRPPRRSTSSAPTRTTSRSR